MSQEVRIGYNIDVNAPGARGATDDLRALQEQESKTAEQFLKSATAADKAASAFDNLEKVLKTVSGGQSVDLGVTKAFNDVRTSMSEVLGLASKIDSERLSIAVDTSDIKRASVEMRTFLALKREIDQAYLRSEVAAAPRGAERINVVRNQRTSDITRLSGVVPEQDLADLERQTHETADRDILTQNLRPVEQRLTAAERTNQRDETKLDEHPDQTRTANNEALRQRLLLLAQSEDSQRRVNALVDQLNAAEANQSAVKYRLDAKNQEIKAQEQLDTLVQKSQTAELSRLDRIEAERQKSLSELGGVLPGSTDVINQSFDQQASVERQRQITQSLAPVERGANTLEAADAKQQEAAAFLEGKEKAVFELRQKELETTRQQALALAKTAEEESAVNAAVNRRIAAEKNHSELQADLRLRQERATAEEAVARLVEKTNQAELSGIQRVNAERQKFHERYKDQSPEIHQQADAAFDKQASQEEQASGRHGNVRRLVLGAKDLAEGYSRGAVIEGVDYLMSLRGGTGGGPGTGSGGAGGVGGLLGGLSGGAKLGLAAGATAASLALVTVKLTEFVEKEAAAARETVNLGLRMGITGSQAQQLADAAGLVGVKIESVEGGARLLSTALEDPSASGKKSADALTKLGISILDVNGKAREMGPVFLDALAAISKLPSAAERMALATKLLGRGAKELEPLISDYDALNKVVNNLHPVDPTKLAEADKKFQELHEHWQELKRDFATKLIPVIEPLVSGFSNVLTGGSSSADQAKEYAYLLGKHPEVKPGDTYTPTPDEHKDYLAKFGPEAEARRRAERLSQTGPQIPQSVFDTSAHEASRFLSGFQVDADTRRAELGEQLKEAQADQKKALDTITDIQKGAGKSNQVTPDVVKKNEHDLATASSQVARLQSQIKALNAGPRTENRYESERDRIAAEDYKATHPASEFGRIPELQVERQERLGTIQRDPQFTPAERKTLNSDIERQSNRDIILEAQRVAGNQEFKRFGTQQIDTNAGIQGLQEQFSNAQRLTALHAGGKDETEADVEQAYQKQLDLARQIRDIHLSDLQVEKAKLAAIGDHSHDTDIAKDEANAHKQFVDEQVKAESDRLLRTEAIRAKEKDEAAKTQEKLAKLQTETEAKSFADKIEHAQKLAALNRQSGESPITGVQQAYETQLKLAQLEHDTVVAENAITYAGTDKDSVGKQKIADEEAYKTLTEERQKAEYEAEEKLAELRKQERDEAKQQAASLYDALRGGEKSTRDFFKAQLNDIGRNIFSAGAAPILQGLSTAINPSGGGIAGIGLQNTLLGSSTGASQAQPGAPTQRPSGFLGQLDHLFGIGPQHQQPQANTPHPAPITAGTPAIDSHAEPLISSLDNNRDALRDLTTAITNITPGGGVGPNPLAQNPLGSAAVPESHEVLPGVTELGASSLVQSSKNAVDAAHALATNPPATPGPIDFSHLGEFLPEPVKAPISIFGQEEEVGDKSPIQSPLFSPNIHVQPSALSVLSPVTGPSYSTTNAYHDGGKVQSPLAAPQTEQVSSTISYGAPIASSPATASAVAPPGPTGPLQLPPPYVSPPPAAPPVPTAENLSPSGFPILGGKELAASSLSDGILAGAKQIGQGLLDTGPTSLLQAAKRYAIDIPLEEGNKAVASFQKGDYLGAAGHTIASLPVVPGLVSDTVAASQQLAQRGQNDVSQGNYLAAASHDLASLVPIIGPTAVAISDNLADSQTALKGIGQIAGLAATGGASALEIPKLNLPADHPIVEALKDETGSVGPGSGWSKLAQSTYKPSTQLKQQLADQSEAELSKALDIPRTQGNAPFDLQNENLGIEIKTLLDNGNDKITMHPESLNRKLATVDNTGVTPYTVVADKRGDTPSYYYKQGLGSFRLSSLTPTDSLADLKHVIDTASAEHHAPTPPSAFQIYSPNEADNLSFNQAVGGLTSPAHQRLFDSSNQIDEALGIKSQQSNAIGDWSDGAENSIFNTIQSAPSFDAVRYSAALKGDLANQKAVIPFEVKPKGPDSLYRVTVPNATPEQLRASLDAEGLQYRTLIPKGKVGTEVSVFDSGSQLRDNIERFADKHNVDYRTYQGQGEYLGGDTREAGHDAYHRVISDYEAKSGDRLHERFVGHELPDAATRPITNTPLPQAVIPPEFSATQRFINQAIPEPDSGPISSLSKSPYGFDVLGDKDLASTALTPGILSDTGTSAPTRPQSAENPWVLPVLPPYQSAPIAQSSTPDQASTGSAFENYAISQFPHVPTIPAQLAALPAQLATPSFATQHPALTRSGTTAAQLVALSAPAAIRTRDNLGDLQYNKYAIGTAAYGDASVLLNALDRRSPATAASGGIGNDILNTVESIFGVKRPTAKPAAQQSVRQANPPSTQAAAAPGQLIPTTVPHFDAYDSKNLKAMGISDADFASAQQYQGFAPTESPFPEEEGRRDNRPVGTSYVIPRSFGARGTVGSNAPAPSGITTVVLDTSGRILEMYSGPSPTKESVSSNISYGGDASRESVSSNISYAGGSTGTAGIAGSPVTNAFDQIDFGSFGSSGANASHPVTSASSTTENPWVLPVLPPYASPLNTPPAGGSSSSELHASFNSQGAQVLSQSVRNAANPLGSTSGIIHSAQAVFSGLTNAYSDFKALQKAIHPPQPATKPVTPQPSTIGPYPTPANLPTQPQFSGPAPFSQTINSEGINGPLPTYIGQTIPGSYQNSGDSLTRLDSGLILRQSGDQAPPTAASSSLTPDVSSSISYSPASDTLPANYESLPGAPALAPAPGAGLSPWELPTLPPFTQADSSAQSGGGFDVVDPNAGAAAIHAATINNGLSSRIAPFNSGGAGILPQSLLNAANPFNSPASAFQTIMKIGGSLAGGVGAAGGLAGAVGGDDSGGAADSGDIGDGSSPSGYATTSTINYGDGSSDSFSGGGLFSDGGAGSDYDSNGNFDFGSLGGSSGDSSSGDVSLGGDSSSGSGGLGSILGSLGGAGGGLANAVSGFSKGGAKGSSSGIASTLGIAAAVDPEPISKAILGISAAVAGIVSALLGDPRAERAKHLTQESETDKIAALAYTQPGINLEESAAGGKSVDTDFQGNSRVLNEKPYVYDINEAIGFDPIHPDRVVTEAVRQIGNQPLPGIPSSPVAPLASTDLTTPVRAQTDTTAYPGTAGSAAQQAQQAQANSPLSSNVTFHNTFNNHSLDGADLMRRAPDLATAISSQLLTSHRIVNDIRNIGQVG